MTAPLRCPACATTHPASERFCAHCGMPLVQSGEEPVLSERQQRARKVKPQYTEGPLVRVAGAQNQPEAEFIQGLLLEEGVPSLVRRSAGFDVPDYMAGGPREVLVPQSAVQTAHEVLLDTDFVSSATAPSVTPAPVRLMAAILLAIAVGSVLLALATHTFS